MYFEESRGLEKEGAAHVLSNIQFASEQLLDLSLVTRSGRLYLPASESYSNTSTLVDYQVLQLAAHS